MPTYTVDPLHPEMIRCGAGQQSAFVFSAGRTTSPQAAFIVPFIKINFFFS
jgi:hypothetical protein